MSWFWALPVKSTLTSSKNMMPFNKNAADHVDLILWRENGITSSSTKHTPLALGVGLPVKVGTPQSLSLDGFITQLDLTKQTFEIAVLNPSIHEPWFQSFTFQDVRSGFQNSTWRVVTDTTQLYVWYYARIPCKWYLHPKREQMVSSYQHACKSFILTNNDILQIAASEGSAVKAMASMTPEIELALVDVLSYEEPFCSIRWQDKNLACATRCIDCAN